ncbi:hypothetical protein LX64_00258 [Chitinophaga skermanii]|uniref:Uncharacterized protein n=1 Tax=Chitinophaga skermanii TaxID=331697 RepID=A0A327R4J5_9BACT|nr:DUF6452 family protein [Chitinophaga skermanii]RAJ10653.1 hypothetical protein LX64_00258 [Chitinophaga skermanii]
MNSMFKLCAGLLLLATTFYACDDQTETCDKAFRASVRMRFKYPRPIDGRVVDTTLPYVTIKSMMGDTVAKNQTGLTGVALPLNGVIDSTWYYFKADSTVLGDTILFRYKRHQQFISPGCGFATYYHLDTVITTRHAIDSIQIINKEVTNNEDIHLYLFY